jgi:uncharacterized DUF497 family protein
MPWPWRAARSWESDPENGVPSAQVDERHFRDERRHLVLGVTNDRRHLLVAFTVRNLVRVISVRPMSRKERVADQEAK